MFGSVDEIPETGKPVAELSGFDRLIREFLFTHKIPGASLALGRQGKLIFARGYGVAESTGRRYIQPDTRFRLASISKPITAHAIARLVDQKRLSVEDRILDRLPPELAACPVRDARWNDIRISHLLRHTGGWDRDKSRDPMFQSREIAKELGAASPPGTSRIIRRQMGRMLDFAPGERYAYSNFGYCLLGRALEWLTGQTYEQSVHDLVFAPLGLSSHFALGRTLRSAQRTDESEYFDRDETDDSVFDAVPGKLSTPYGAWCLEDMDSHGGWTATAPALVHWSQQLALPESGGLRPETWWANWERPAGTAGWKPNGEALDLFYGFGWQVREYPGRRLTRWHNGSLDGTSTQLVHRHDDLCWALLFNSRKSNSDKTPVQVLDSEMHRVSAQVSQWPDADLWDQFPVGKAE